jgi:hypothetical protein
MTLGDFFANGEADACTGILATVVKALENDEDAIALLGRNADAIVADLNGPGGALAKGGNLDAWRERGAEFDGVGDEILEELSELDFVGHYHGKSISPDVHAAFLDGDAKIFQGAIECGVAANRLERFTFRADAGKCEEIVDERLHPLAAIHGEVDELAGFVVQLAGVTLGKQLGEAGNGAEGFLEIVRSDVGELL